MSAINKENGIMKNIIILLSSHKLSIIFSFACTFILASASICAPILTQNLMDKGVMLLNIKVTTQYVVYITILFLIQEGLSFIQGIIHINMQNKVHLDLEVESFSKILRMKVQYLKNEGFASIFSTISCDIDTIAQVANKSFLILAMQIFKVIGGIIGLMLISYKLTLFILIIVPVKYLIINKLTEIKTNVFNKFLLVTEKIGMWYGDIMNGVEEIKLWNLYQIKKNEYRKLQSERFKLSNKFQVLDQISENSGSLLQNIIFNYLYILGIALIIKEEITIGVLITFVTYSEFVITPISLFMTIKYEIANIKPAFENYFKFISGIEENQDIKELKKLQEPKVIRFNEVSLTYDSKKVLSHINLELTAGEKVAFVGANGSGKSSLFNLLLRFYDPTEGAIYIDDLDIQKIDIDKYRDLFAVMSQDSYLFNTTIKNNISLQNTLSVEEIQKQCIDKKIESFLKFIEELPKEFQTDAGIRGSKLSGGEKQKVALIRTLLKKNSPILVLDEATSNYDMESEQLFNRLVSDYDTYPFVFIITHRPEILEHMDKIVVLDQGHIICVDSYKNLLKSNQIMPEILQNNCLQRS